MSEGQGDRRRVGQLLLGLLWLTLLVLAMKLWIGWALQSLSLIASSLHTLVASFSILLNVIALTSPYITQRDVLGHSKLESILSFMLSALMGFAGFSLLAISAQQLEAVLSQSPPLLSVHISLFLLRLPAALAAAIFCLACLTGLQASKMDNSALRMSANHLFQDFWLMMIVLGGLVGTWQNYVWLDPLLAIVLVVIAIAHCGWVMNRQLPSLIQQVAIAPEALAQTVHQIEGITHCYDILTRGIVGRQIYVEMRLILHPECVSIARTIAERVERTIRERYGPARVVIYIDTDHIEGKSSPRSNSSPNGKDNQP
jgi:cation diffusion facilitator family transporter